MSDYQHILTALDLASPHAAILDKAMKLGGAATKHSLVHVIEPVPYPENYFGSLPVDLLEKTQAYAKEAFESIAAEYNIPDEQCHIIIGYAGQSIHELAESLEADLVVVGSHGKHGLQLLMGSTTTKIIHGAQCDVLAVRIYD